MKVKIVFAASFALVSVLLAVGCQPPAGIESRTNQPAARSTPQSTPQPTQQSAANIVSTPSDEVFDGTKVVKTEDEWRTLLTAEQFYVLREEGTERSYSGEYDKHKEAGTYHCAACRLKLFSSKTKFESGTGWPSFYQPINANNVTEKVDKSHGETRTEVECSRCGSHLGHVFDDGPKPTGLRYCMNSVALKFEKN